MTASYDPGSVLDDVAIFPLPQVVLFPGALMPLHVFEPRYRSMTRDVLATTRQLVIAHIPEDHTIDSSGQPGIAGVAGVGEIVHADALPDGRFNILVEGKARARIEELPFRRPYRRGRLTLVGQPPAQVDPALVRALKQTATQLAAVIRECHSGFKFCLPATDDAGSLADSCAHYLVLDGAERQKLLEMLDPAERINACLEALVTQQSALGGPCVMH